MAPSRWRNLLSGRPGPHGCCSQGMPMQCHVRENRDDQNQTHLLVRDEAWKILEQPFSCSCSAIGVYCCFVEDETGK
jgi:hypothetical protein